MKAIILAAGYATRLYPLTTNKAKPLLPIGEKAIIDYIVSSINEINAIDCIYVVTNSKFYGQFLDWKKSAVTDKKLVILDDGTSTEDDRRGAIGDILYTIQEKRIDDELLIIAGDNFFTYSLDAFYQYYKNLGRDCVSVKENNDLESLKQFGIALLDEKKRIIDIEEKPSAPKSNKVVYATYFYTQATTKLFQIYMDEGNKPDAPGNFLVWLHKRKDVYAYVFEGECYDIGTPQAYDEVCRLFANS